MDTVAKIATTRLGRAILTATITVPRVLILLDLDETRKNIGIIFCCDGGGR